MKRFITLLSGLLLAAVIGLAQGKWEQAGVTPYGTGGINRSGERIDNSYNSGKFNSEQKSTSKNNPYVYFRKGSFSVPARTYNPGTAITVSMDISVKRHSGNGTPKGSAGAVLVNGKAGQGTSVPTQVNVSGKDAAKRGTVKLTVPTHSAAGNNFSIVYSCFDIKVVYLYRWVEDATVEAATDAATAAIEAAAEAVREVAAEAAIEELASDAAEGAIAAIADDDYTTEVFVDTVAAYDDEDGLMLGETILPLEDSSAYISDEIALDEPVHDPFFQKDKSVQEDGKKGKGVIKKADSDVALSIFGLDLSKKDVVMYSIIGGLVLLILVLLIVLLCRKSPEKKAAKQEAKKAAAEAKASAKAEAAEKAAAAKAERDAKLAEQKAAAAEKAALAKAAAAEKAAVAKAEREAKLAEQKAKQEEQKTALAAKQAELKAKKEAAAAAAAAKAEEKPAEAPAPAGKRFCENCGAPLDPDAAFCENCGTKIS